MLSGSTEAVVATHVLSCMLAFGRRKCSGLCNGFRNWRPSTPRTPPCMTLTLMPQPCHLSWAPGSVGEDVLVVTARINHVHLDRQAISVRRDPGQHAEPTMSSVRTALLSR
jgi:hypothetical protein